MAVLSEEVIPVLTYTDATPISGVPDTRTVVGVAPGKRIVYWGEVQMFLNRGSSSVGGFPNATGQTTNDGSKLLANIWGWIVEEMVLAE